MVRVAPLPSTVSSALSTQTSTLRRSYSCLQLKPCLRAWLPVKNAELVPHSRLRRPGTWRTGTPRNSQHSSNPGVVLTQPMRLPSHLLEVCPKRFLFCSSQLLSCTPHLAQCFGGMWGARTIPCTVHSQLFLFTENLLSLSSFCGRCLLDPVQHSKGQEVVLVP